MARIGPGSTLSFKATLRYEAGGADLLRELESGSIGFGSQKLPETLWSALLGKHAGETVVLAPENPFMLTDFLDHEVYRIEKGAFPTMPQVNDVVTMPVNEVDTQMTVLVAEPDHVLVSPNPLAMHPVKRADVQIVAIEGGILIDADQVAPGGVLPGALTVAGALAANGGLYAGTSDIYFTQTNHDHWGFGNTPGFAAIENSANYNTLMILGRTTVPFKRRVSVWDELNVNGSLNVVGGPVVVQQAHTIKIGLSEGGAYGNDGIRGEPNLWLDAADTVFIKKGFQARGMDIAERFRVLEAIEPGEVVVMGDVKETVERCTRAHDTRVIGIASADPAFILGMEQEEVPVALCGRVPCNVDADVASIAVGDLLTTSATPGHAQKVLDREEAVGAIVGKAMEPMERGKGKILVLVMAR
jgi:hypothetical protein